ncbi:hypothetical protein [Thermomonas flagellata]|uniref:hypothetical protein n=1 Tax=Thermomonas flagellata TaxID=2888524 RepID=UPI001F0501E0|nr:hypothetical protein [Thermomonas flagellata]
MTDPGARTGRWVARRWPAIRTRGRWRCVRVRGLALWSGGMCLAMLAMTGLRLGPASPRDPRLAAIALPLCASGGLAWGLPSWFLNERLHRALQQQRRHIP